MNQLPMAILASTGILFTGCAKSNADNAKVSLVVNIDDLGSNPDIAEGAVRLWKAGAISSVSVIAFGEDFDHTVRLLKENKVPMGVHLALNHGAGVLGATEVPSLHAPKGRFWDTPEETFTHMMIHEVRRELDAQIRKLLDTGITPVHLDCHMGLVFDRPELLEIYRSLAIGYKTALALPSHSYFDATRAALASQSLPSSVSLEGIHELPNGTEETLENRKKAYEELLSTLKPGINHLYSHPAPPTEAVKANYNDYRIRNNDYAFFLSPEWKELLTRKNIELVGY